MNIKTTFRLHYVWLPIAVLIGMIVMSLMAMPGCTDQQIKDFIAPTVVTVPSTQPTTQPTTQPSTQPAVASVTPSVVAPVVVSPTPQQIADGVATYLGQNSALLTLILSLFGVHSASAITHLVQTGVGVYRKMRSGTPPTAAQVIQTAGSAAADIAAIDPKAAPTVQKI